MSISSSCPQCGKPLAPGAPMGLCPECLMQAGFPTGGVTATYVPPTPEELERNFPGLKILELLGRGGMGVVYKARQRELDRLVALKILPNEKNDPAFAERFSREARALAKLNHPHIVTVYDFGQTSGLFYFIMEYVDGLNLRQLQATSKIAPTEALAIVPQICEALQYAHNQGIVHRDIKPENILLDKNGHVKIADFGLAKIVGPEPQDLSLTMAGEIMGTPHYMAPEQVEHPQTVDHRADIYSLGVVFYQMLTGELPLGHFAPPSRKVEIDVRLDEVVLRALEKEPERRYQQAGALKTQVETIVRTPGETAPAEPTPPPHFYGFEYRSKRTLWGLPWLHVAVGADPKTWRTREAKGIVAIGGKAKGVFAFGGLAMGGFAFGGCGIGLISFSGLSFGVIAVGGLALALLVAWGGAAISLGAAAGGLAIGYVARGGLALGTHAWSANTRDPFAQSLLGWIDNPWVSVSYIILTAVSVGVTILVPWWLRYRSVARPAAKRRWYIWILPGILGIATIGVLSKYIANGIALRDQTNHLKTESAKAASPSFSQTGMTAIQPDGLIRFTSTFTKLNRGNSAVQTDRFVNSDFVHVDRISDAQGRSLAFTARPGVGNHINYTVTLPEPVQPGGAITTTLEGTMTGLVKAREQSGEFEYYMKHYPACDVPVRYAQQYQLPAGATLLETKPANLRQQTAGDRTELAIDRVIPPGGFIEVRFVYQLKKASASTENMPPHATSAKAFVLLLSSEKFEQAVTMFTPVMRGAMNAQQLETLWKQLGATGGKFLGVSPTIPTVARFEVGYDVVYVNCLWERTELALKIVFDADGKITGLWIVPWQKEQ